MRRRILLDYWYDNLLYILGDLIDRDWFAVEFDIYFGFWLTVAQLKHKKVFLR